MSGPAVDWRGVSDYLLTFGAFLGYVALALEIVLHYADLKKMIMRPNFRLAMYPIDEFSASISVTNAKTSWRVCDATECEGKLAIKKHETLDREGFDVKETTPLTWEGEEYVLRRLPAGSPLPEYLQAFVYEPQGKTISVRVRGGGESWIEHPSGVDVFVQIQSGERTVGKWLRNIDIVQCVRKRKFPDFTDHDS
jgi:hypothetical protein